MQATHVNSSRTDGYWASVGKASIGSAAAAGVLGFFGGSVGALPAAIWAAPGGLAAGAIGEYFERQGLGNVTGSLAGSASVAAPALGVALLASRANNPSVAGAAMLLALGAAGAGGIGALWG